MKHNLKANYRFSDRIGFYWQEALLQQRNNQLNTSFLHIWAKFSLSTSVILKVGPKYMYISALLRTENIQGHSQEYPGPTDF